MKKQIYYILIVLSVSCSGFLLFEGDIISRIVSRLRHFTETNYQEKVYLQTDADVYYAGDILWFTTRIFDAQHTSSNLSKIVHVKLYDGNKNELFHKKIDTNEGIGNADILLPDTLVTGIYHLTGYTEWMRNFEHNIFHKEIYIINGKIDTSEKLSDDQNEIDVSFFPEGGSLNESMVNRIGFKVLSSKGLGVNIRGVIVDEKQDTLVTVNTYKYGLGSFLLNPKSGKDYYLNILQGDSIIKFALPQVQKDGVNLMVINDDPEIYKIKIEVSRGFKRSNSKIILLSHCRGKVNFAAEGTSKHSEINIPSSKLDPGINSITVFNEDGIPLAERLIFKQPKVAPTVKITNLKERYGRRRKVELQLDSELPIDANVTISVHDRSSMSSKNIENYLLLESDIKGHIENSGFYFNDTDSARKAADNLMLTQGWRRYSWETILKDSTTNLSYIPEKEGVIFRGKLINKLTGSAVSDTILIMSVINEYPNFLFRHHKRETEFAFAFYKMYGKHQVFINVLADESFNNYVLAPADEYDKCIGDFNTSGIFENFRSYDYIDLKRKDDLIINNYKRYRPELFLPQKVQEVNEQITLNQLSSPDYELNPDQFIPLKNFKEVILELVPPAVVKKKNGKDNIFVIKSESLTGKKPDLNEMPATAFLNGIPVFDNDIILNQEYKNIKNVRVYTGEHYLAGHPFYGFISVTTKDKGSNKDYFANASNATEFEGLSMKREFYAPKYATESSYKTTMPDFRHLLFWQPNLLVKKGDKTIISFFTSDLLNDFHVNIEGITTDGLPIHFNQKFTTAPDDFDENSKQVDP